VRLFIPKHNHLTENKNNVTSLLYRCIIINLTLCDLMHRYEFSRTRIHGWFHDFKGRLGCFCVFNYDSNVV